MKARLYATETEENRSEAIAAAQSALREKKTIVIPTDTVYGIAADAFAPEGVTALLAAKGRSRTMPPPVLIFDEAVLPGLADGVSADATALARRFWPGALTLILYSQPSLKWDLGQTQGTVALRVPNDQLTIDLLRQTGPLAVSSANKTGRTAATSAQEAAEQLGEDVELILDAGTRPTSRLEGQNSAEILPSTIVDCTSDRLVVVREGAISVDELRQVVPSLVTKEELESDNLGASLPTLPQSEQDRSRAEAGENRPTLSGLGDGPRAVAPQEGSLAADLVGETTGATIPVDQVRTQETHLGKRHRQRINSATQPITVAEARSLVFSNEKDKKNS